VGSAVINAQPAAAVYSRRCARVAAGLRTCAVPRRVFGIADVEGRFNLVSCKTKPRTVTRVPSQDTGQEKDILFWRAKVIKM
jgi:hypothetical protein